MCLCLWVDYCVRQQICFITRAQNEDWIRGVEVVVSPAHCHRLRQPPLGIYRFHGSEVFRSGSFDAQAVRPNVLRSDRGVIGNENLQHSGQGALRDD